QPYLPRDAQFFSPREQQYGGRPQQQGGERHHRGDDSNVGGLPSFITGGQPQPQQQGGSGQHSQNGYEGQGERNGERNSGDRSPMHRRRRRHRGPRGDMPRGIPEAADEQGPHGE